MDEKSITLQRYGHVGGAVDTDSGLVVPVIRDAERQGVVEISRDLADISTRAREHGLTAEDLSGTSFTMSSPGGIGGAALTPIVNRPQVAILGVSRAVVAPARSTGWGVPLAPSPSWPGQSGPEPARTTGSQLTVTPGGGQHR